MSYLILQFLGLFGAGILTGIYARSLIMFLRGIE